MGWHAGAWQAAVGQSAADAQVILDDKASEVEGRPGTYRLHRAGTELQADVAYFTSGIRPFSGWLRGQHSDVLDPAGFVKVRAALTCMFQSSCTAGMTEHAAASCLAHAPGCGRHVQTLMDCAGRAAAQGVLQLGR